MGGLFAVHLFRTIGWEVSVFERSGDDLASRGAGIGASEALFAVMRRAGVPFDSLTGVQRVRSRVCLDGGGTVIAEVPAGGMATAWARIYRALRGALPAGCCHFNRSLTRVDQDPHGVTAEFADGARVTADLLVAADGIGSTVRRQLLPQVDPRYAGYVAWRGVVEERDTPAQVRARLFEHLTFCFPEGELLLAMPNPGAGDDTRPGKRRYYFVWYRPVDYEKTLPGLCTDASGRQHGVAIPPPLIRADVIEDLRASAVRALAPELAAVVARAEHPLLQAVFDCESSRIAFGRVALVGDAAFVARPHVAAGVTKAALDALSLVEALAASGGSLDRALEQYDRDQRSFGGRLVARGRALGAHLEAQQKAPDRGRGPTRDWDPALYMREYGADDLVAERHHRLVNSA